MTKPDQPAKPDADPYAERRGLTFEQAEGVEPLPSQLQLKELSPLLRAALWKMVLERVESDTFSTDYSGRYVQGGWANILKDRFVYRLHRPADELSLKSEKINAELKKIIWNGDYVEVFGFLQYVIRHPNCPYQFGEQINLILKITRAAYAVVDKMIVPIASDSEHTTLKQAFADLASTEFHGARKHLQTAAEHLTSGKLPDSIRESIHAVESVIRVLEPDNDFSRALEKLDAKIAIHGAMKAGFGKLYGYTSDEKGIRHPLLDEPVSNVDDADALFMIGACAAFVSYLINKARTAGLLKQDKK